MSGAPNDFGPTRDPGVYVPFAGAERALEALESWAYESQRPAVVLVGARGMGKTLLLEVFASRVVDRFAAAYVPRPDVDLDELCRTILEALGREPERTSRPTLAEVVQEIAGEKLLLLIDDAHALPPRNEVWLFDLARRSGGAVRVVLTVADDRLAGELAAAFGADTQLIALDTPMTRAESDALVHAELARVRAGDAICSRFDGGRLEAIHARSGGVPARLKQEVEAVVARAERELAPRAPVRPREPARPAAAPEKAHAPGILAAAYGPPAVSRAHRSEARFDLFAPPAPPTHAARRDPFSRSLLWPLALAASFALGFMAAHAIEGLRPAQQVLAPVAAAPPAAARGIGTIAAAPIAPQALPGVAPPIAPQVPAPAVAIPPVAAAPIPAVGAVPIAPVAAPIAPAGAASSPYGVSVPAAVSVPASPLAAAPSAPAPAAPAAQVESPAPPLAVAPLPAPAAALAPAEAASQGPPDVAAPPPALAVEPEAVAAAPVPEEIAAPAPAPAEARPVASAAPAAAPAARRAPAPRRAARTPVAAKPVVVRISAEPGADITIDGVPVGAAEIPLARGSHRVVARLSDGRVIDRVIDVRGTHYNLSIR